MNGDSGTREGVPMRTNTAKGTRAIAACGACALAVAMTGCGASFEGSGSKDAASAEQLAMHADDPWAVEIGANSKAQSDFTLVDGVYTGTGLGMDGLITVTLAVQGNHINCIEVTQEGETQSVGGFEAIRDGKYAAMIDAEQVPISIVFRARPSPPPACVRPRPTPLFRRAPTCSPWKWAAAPPSTKCRRGNSHGSS